MNTTLETCLKSLIPANHVIRRVFESGHKDNSILVDIRVCLSKSENIDTRLSVLPSGEVKHVASVRWYKTSSMRAWAQHRIPTQDWVAEIVANSITGAVTP